MNGLEETPGRILVLSRSTTTCIIRRPGCSAMVLIPLLRFCMGSVLRIMDSVNDKSVAKVDNQHRIYWIDVTEAVRRGENSMVVAFTNPAECVFSFVPHL